MKSYLHNARCAMFATIVLAALSCRSMNKSQITSMVPDPGQTVGSGYDSIAGQIRRTCVQLSPLEDPTAPGINTSAKPTPTDATIANNRSEHDVKSEQKVTSIATHINSTEELARNLGIDPIEFVWNSRPPSSLSNLVEAQSISQYSTNFLIWIKVVHKAQVMRNVKLQPEFEKMLLGESERFFQLCGDNFVGGSSHGDFFYALITIKNRSLEEQSKNLNALNTILNSNSDVMTSIALSNIKSASVYSYQFGNSETAKIINSIRSVLDYRRNFLSKSTGSKGVVAMYLRSYEFTTLAPYNEPLKNVRGTLTRMGKARLNNLSLMYQIDYVLSNVSSFSEVDQAQLSADRSRFAANAAKIMESAKLCLTDAKNCQFDEKLQADRNYKLPALKPV